MGEELGTCLQCGYHICFMDGCEGNRACTDSLPAQIDGAILAASNGMASTVEVPSPESLAYLLSSIDAAIQSVHSVQ